MEAKLNIAIIGPGKVGTALTVLAGRAGYQVVALGARNRQRAAGASRRISGHPVAVSPAEAAAVADIVLLTVSDSAIASVCDDLAEMGAFKRSSIVAHCCGALGSHVLASAKRLCGCRIASMHPLQTFPSAQAAVDSMPGAYFFLEGDANAVTELSRFVRAIGGKAVKLPGGVKAKRTKALYHASACMASNYLAALMDAAIAAAKLAGIPAGTAWPALEKLVQATLRNVSAFGPAKALTGPISRGDAETVRRHLDALAKDKALDHLYRALGLWTADLARRKGTIDAKTQRQLRALLVTE